MNAREGVNVSQNLTLAMVLAGVLLTSAVSIHAEEKTRPLAPPGTVTLPVTDYDRLVDRAARPPKRPEPAPVPAVLARAEAKLRIEKNTARGTFQLEGEVFRTGAAKVPLLAGDTVLDARALGKPLPLLRENGIHSAVLTGPSPFLVTLDWGTAVLQEPGRVSFVLPVPPAGSARATLVLQGEQADVQVEPGVVTRRASARGETVVEATLVPGSLTRFRWSSSREATPAAPRETRILADWKTLVTLGEADLRLTLLLDVTVVQGEPDRFDVRLPAGFEVVGVSGPSLESTQEAQATLTLVVRDAARRRHAFLVSLERDAPGASYRTDLPLPALVGAQRETGEVAVEGVGTLELQATEGGTLRRLDVREVHSALRSLSRDGMLAAFRFHRRADEAPTLALEVKRYPDAPVLAAVAERAVATTLVTTEGRQLTEVALTVRNHAQPFLKVALPEGATLLSAEVAGEGVKPVLGADGTRVPLLRTGFKPSGPYTVSFVYLHSGAAFAKKGDATFGLPKMDVPVNVVEWELFLPERYRVKDVGGNVLRADLAGLAGRGIEYDVAGGVEGGVPGGVVGGVIGGLPDRMSVDEVAAIGIPGIIQGRLADESGQPLPGVTVTAEGSGISRTALTDGAGSYVLAGLPPGPVRLTASLSGFSTEQRQIVVRPQAGVRADLRLKVGTIAETITVTAETPLIDTKGAGTSTTFRDESRRPSAGKGKDEPAQLAPSLNVANLQRRVAGVLPVHIDIPRSGASYRFVRPLVLDEETTVSLRYRKR